MGQGLPKPVTPIVVKRSFSSSFRVGFAEMNGWRNSMEDAHVIFMQDQCGFFGVLDGHGGDQCSKYIARRLEETLPSGVPVDDAAMSELMLRLDREYLETKQPSGSTGTFAVLRQPTGTDSQYSLRVANIGDSRVLLGRADGSLVDHHGGTDGGITTDHKPDHPVEKERICRTGGRVEMVMGVARVNGELSLSRAFGDAQHKETGGPAQEDHPVTCAPEHHSLTCDATDFIVLACDGISESNFSNQEVVSLIAEELRAAGSNPDPGAAAASVCRRALDRGSKDNLSCMIVLPGGGEIKGAEKELFSAPFDAPESEDFQKAYSAMVEHAGLSLPEALERRYDDVLEQRANQKGSELDAELNAFGNGPDSSLLPRSPERIKYFEEWLAKQSNMRKPPARDAREEMFLRYYQQQMQQQAAEDAARLRVRLTADCELLRREVDKNKSLTWDKQLERACGNHGFVLKRDTSDGTSQVKFPAPINFTAWLPTCTLKEEEAPKVRVTADVELLRREVERNVNLKWHDRLAQACGSLGIVAQTDESDKTSQVKFSEPVNFTAWLPTCTLTEEGEAEEEEEEEETELAADADEGGEDGPPRVAKRRRTSRLATTEASLLSLQAEVRSEPEPVGQ